MTVTLKEIRNTYLNFFAKNGHKIVPSSSLVPDNDPTLMFTNSGMVQFKNILAGNETRDYTRATTSQKSVRAGGKHNDLDSVGYDVRHHTFFEMLGNFSFGDYFKDDAIRWAWELLTKDFDMPKDRLAVTIYHNDDEAYNIWKKVSGLPDDRIIRIATKDNFWQMIPAPVVPAPKSFMTTVRKSGADCQERRKKTATAGLKSGIWSLTSLKTCRTVPVFRSSARRLTPAWGWNAFPPFCRASIPILKLIFFKS